MRGGIVRGLNRFIYDVTPIGSENSMRSKEIHAKLGDDLQKRYSYRVIAHRLIKMCPRYMSREIQTIHGRKRYSLFWRAM